MKKTQSLICFTLSLLMLLSVLAGCRGEDNTSEEASGSGISASESIGDESGSAQLDTALLQGINGTLTGEADRGLTPVLVTEGKEYTSSSAASDAYPDEGGELTDGEIARAGSYSNACWVGFNVGGELIFEIDLGEDVEGIADIGLNMLYDSQPSIGVASKIEFWVQSSTQEYTFVGAHTPAADSELNDQSVYEAVLRLQGTLTANKIKIVLKSPRRAWIFVSEVYAYKYIKTEGDDIVSEKSYYPEVSLPQVDTPEYWSEAEADYNETKNLALGLSYWFKESFAIDETSQTDHYNTQPSNGFLTDGKRASVAGMGDTSWVRFTRGGKRAVFFDLGKTSAVSGMEIGFLYDSQPAIYLPRIVTVWVSEDGKGWMQVYVSTAYNTDKSADFVRKKDDFGGEYKARFVKIEFAVNPHVYIDEIEIYGRKNASEAKDVVPTSEGEDTYKNEYASSEKFGINDVLLSYIPGRKDADQITEEVFLPHVAYIKDGEIKDMLFDSFMFLPYTKFLYDYENNAIKRPLTMTDWQEYIDTQFMEGSNMNALESAVQKAKEALDMPDYKVTVHMSLFYPVKSVREFGVVNGKMLDFSKNEDRLEALKWAVDTQLAQFEAQGYKNIELAAFYWFTEEVDFSDDGIVYLLKEITNYVREKGYYTSWIPYYQASGFDYWEELGFDLACYQPNYAFNFSIPKSRLYEAAVSAKKLGMCIEIEVGEFTLPDVDRLKDYFYAAAVNGIMDGAIHMYYQGGVPGVFYMSYKSDDEYLNSLYDDLYKFINFSFETEVSSPDSGVFEGEGTVEGTISGTPTKTVKSVDITVSPKYGTVVVDSDGSFVYTPYEGYKGEDYFEVAYDYGYISSDAAKISLNVK